MAASDGAAGGAWAAGPAKPTVPKFEQCGVLLGSWCLLLDGDERHGNPYGVWLTSFIELSASGIAVHDHRVEAERRRASFHVPFAGTLFSVCSPESQPHLFVAKLEICNPNQPAITHSLALSSRADCVLWTRALAPFIAKIPHIVETCIESLQSNNAHQVEGVFRRSGSKQQMQKIKDLYDKHDHVSLLSSGDPHVVAGVLKAYVQELPEPLIPAHLFDQFTQVASFPRDARALGFSSLVSQLPLENQWLLARLLDYLRFIAAHEAVNLMTIENLAICFGPCVLRKGGLAPQEEVKVMAAGKAAFIALLDVFADVTVARATAEMVRRMRGDSEVVHYGPLVGVQYEFLECLSTPPAAGAAWPHDARCADTYGERLVIGTDTGAAVQAVGRPFVRAPVRRTAAPPPASPASPPPPASLGAIDGPAEWLPLPRKTAVHKIAVVDELNLILAIVGDSYELVSFHHYRGAYVQQKVDGTDGCHDFVVGFRGRLLNVVVAVRASLVMYELAKVEEKGGFSFSQRKEFYMPAPSATIALCNGTVVVGFRELSQFSLLNVETSQMDRLFASKEDRAPRAVTYIAATDEYFVAFSDIGVFLSGKTGKRTRLTDVAFDEPPTAVCAAHPHLLIVCHTSVVSVVRVVDGAVVQSLSPSAPLAGARSFGEHATRGWLRVQEGLFEKTWPLRWLVLVGPMLYGFHSDRGDVSLFAVSIQGADVKDADFVLRKQHTLCVYVRGGQRYFFMADSADDAAAWRLAFERAAARGGGGADEANALFDGDLPADVRSWTVDHVGAYVSMSSLEDIVLALKERAMDGAALLALSRQDAKQLPISVGKRIVLLKRAAALREFVKAQSNAARRDRSERAVSLIQPLSPLADKSQSRLRLLTSKDIVLLAAINASTTSVVQLSYRASS